jgi:hypothetical protein
MSAPRLPLRPRWAPRARLRQLSVALWTVAWVPSASAAIYTCVDAKGRTITSDRPVPECQAREQRLLNPSGSTSRTVGPARSEAERAADEARQQQAAREAQVRSETAHRDRSLLRRFASETQHQAARTEALNTVAQSGEVSKLRIEGLKAERKTLLRDIAQAPTPTPVRMKQRLNAVDAGLAAQESLVQNQAAELARINASFDADLQRLRLLWAGLRPGEPAPAAASAMPAAAATGVSRAASSANR